MLRQYSDGDHSFEIDVESQLNAWAKVKLESIGCHDIPNEKALLVYFEHCIRVPSPKPRLVKISKELKCPSGCEVAFERLKIALSDGKDIHQFLSKRVYSGKENKEDGMLYDWSLLHFHFCTREEKSNELYKESWRYLLIAYMNPLRDDVIYLLQIVPHRNINWADSSYLEILRENWADELSMLFFSGYLCLKDGSRIDLSENEIINLRKNGIHTLAPVTPQTLYISPSLGCQNNERSTLASIEAMTICNQFNALVLYLSGHIELLVKKLQILTQTNHVILVPVATDIQRGIFCIEEESILVVVDHSTIECVLFEKGQRDETIREIAETMKIGFVAA